MKRNSVRKSPTPSAPHLSASSASEAEPRFAATSMRRPSPVRASTCLYASSAARSSAIACDIFSNLATVSLSGSVMAEPSVPSTATVSACRAPERASPTPTTAGMPMERAMIETCEVLEPSAVTNASAMPFGMRAVSEGARLLARTTEGVCRASNPDADRPISSAEIWRVTSLTSSARAERYSSSMAANSAAYSSGGEHGCLGALQVLHAFFDGGVQLGVFGHLRVKVEDAGLVLVPRLAQSVGGLGNPSDHDLDSVSKPSKLGLHLAFVDAGSLRFWPARPGDEGGANGHAFGGPYARQFHRRRPRLVFIGGDHLCQGFHGLFSVLAIGTNGHLFALPGKPGNLDDALGVYLPIPLHENDLG